MIKTVKEGLEIYKKQVKEYLQRCNEIDAREKQWRQAAGTDYMGSMDWPKGDWEWKNKAEEQMVGMEIALGLSAEEVKEILVIIEKDLQKRTTG